MPNTTAICVPAPGNTSLVNVSYPSNQTSNATFGEKRPQAVLDNAYRPCQNRKKHYCSDQSSYTLAPTAIIRDIVNEPTIVEQFTRSQF